MSLNLLAIDTSAATSVSILRGDAVLAEVNFAGSMMHVESIATAISEALSTAGIKGREVNAVVVGRGPAPFTGLRVGLAAGTVFAQAVSAELFGVVSLDALAWSALQNPELLAKVSSRTPLLVTADARRSEVYWALYSGLTAEGVPQRTDLPGVNKPAALEELLVDRNLEVVRASIRDENPPIATALGRVAQALLSTDALPYDTSPMYLRAPDAVLPKPHARFGKAEYSKPVTALGAEQ